MLYKNLKAMIRSTEKDIDFFDLLDVVLQEKTLVAYICNLARFF